MQICENLRPEKEYEAVIGMEVHIQVKTETKLFCSCPVVFEADPNTLICPVCAGFPGTLPVLNKTAVKLAVRTALAFGCEVQERSIFSRKNYFYPDLPKGYQITQYEYPVAKNGRLKLGKRVIRIRRLHLEEDSGKLIHRENRTLIDLNRAGVPLIEIVTEPDIHTPQEAYSYIIKMREILRYLNVSNGDMEKGELRCEPNISVHLKGEPFGTRREIKNLNSIKEVEEGIRYEISSQIDRLKKGCKVRRATLLWNTRKKQTEEMRGKETEADYRYFDEPDLLPLHISPSLIEEERLNIGELPDDRRARMEKEYGLEKENIDILVSRKPLADYFEDVARLTRDPKRTSGFILVEFLGFLNEKGLKVEEKPIACKDLSELINFLKKGDITRTVARNILPLMASGESPARIIKRLGLESLERKDEIEDVVQRVLQQYPEEVTRYKNGKGGLFGFFIGEVMKATKGKANPTIVGEMLREQLSVERRA